MNVLCSAQRVLTPPRQHETAPSNQSIAAGGLGKAGAGILQTRAWDDCSSTSSWVLPYPGDAAHSPKKIYVLICTLAGDAAEALLCGQGWSCCALQLAVRLLGMALCGSLVKSKVFCPQ